MLWSGICFPSFHSPLPCRMFSTPNNQSWSWDQGANEPVHPTASRWHSPSHWECSALRHTRHLQVSHLEPWQKLSHAKRFLSPDPEDIDVFLCAHLSTKSNCFLFIPFAHMIFQDCYASFSPLGNFRTTKKNLSLK